MERFDALALVLDELLVRQEIFLHRLAPFLHLLHCLQLRDKLLVLSLHQGHLSIVVLDDGVFVAQILLEEGHGWLNFRHLLGQHLELFFHQGKAALGCIQLILHVALDDLEVMAIFARLGGLLERLAVLITAARGSTLLRGQLIWLEVVSTFLSDSEHVGFLSKHRLDQLVGVALRPHENVHLIMVKVLFFLVFILVEDLFARSLFFRLAVRIVRLLDNYFIIVTSILVLLIRLIGRFAARLRPSVLVFLV